MRDGGGCLDHLGACQTDEMTGAGASAGTHKRYYPSKSRGNCDGNALTWSMEEVFQEDMMRQARLADKRLIRCDTMELLISMPWVRQLRTNVYITIFSVDLREINNKRKFQIFYYIKNFVRKKKDVHHEKKKYWHTVLHVLQLFRAIFYKHNIVTSCIKP